jgi:hypothetical protein
MARNRKVSRRGIKIHRNYTVDEVARNLGLAKATVRRWIKSGLPALTERRPTIVLGSDLAQFLLTPKVPRQTCQLYECYCVKCRSPQKPAGEMAEYISLTPSTGNLRGICPACGIMMHKRIRRDVLPSLCTILDLTIAQAPSRLRE